MKKIYLFQIPEETKIVFNKCWILEGQPVKSSYNNTHAWSFSSDNPNNSN